MEKLSLDSIVSIKDNLLSSEVDGEILMMDIETGNYIGFNEVGSEIWKIISKQSTSINTICDKLTQSFDIEKDICKKETLAFCNKMLTENLIRLP